MKYAWIDTQRGVFPLPDMCQVLAVSVSGYRAWRGGGEPDSTRLGDAHAVAPIKGVHTQVKAAYGSRRKHSELQARGHRIGLSRVERAMSEHGMTASMSRKGNYWDDAPGESFSASLKGERVHGTGVTGRSNKNTLGFIRKFPFRGCRIGLANRLLDLRRYRIVHAWHARRGRGRWGDLGRRCQTTIRSGGPWRHGFGRMGSYPIGAMSLSIERRLIGPFLQGHLGRASITAKNRYLGDEAAGVDPLMGADAGPDCAPAFAGFFVATSDFEASASTGGLPALLPTAEAEEAAGLAADWATAADASAIDIASVEQTMGMYLANVMSVSCGNRV